MIESEWFKEQHRKTNEVKVTVQNGTANVYTNGKVLGKPIIFDAGIVFERVTLGSIKSDARLSDIKGLVLAIKCFCFFIKRGLFLHD